MTRTTIPTMTAGADTGALIAASRTTELEAALATADASHLGAYLASRTPPLPVRMSRTVVAAARAARREWARRELVVPAGTRTAPSAA